MIGVQQVTIKGGHDNRVIDIGLFNWKDDSNAKECFLDMLKSGGLIHKFSPTEVFVIEASRLDKIEGTLFSGKRDEMAELVRIAENFEARLKGFKEYVGEIKYRKAFLALNDEFDDLGKGEN